MTRQHPIVRETQDHDVAVKDFLGVNTQAGRTAIAENEFAWLENVMPVGYANLKCVPAAGAAVATIAAVTITHFKYHNIANVDYLMCFCSDGSGYAVNLSSFAVTLIGAAATFTGTVQCSQWKNERALIIASNNYWSWDLGAGLIVLGGITGAPTAGQTISTFAGRVWIGNNRTVSFSAPNSYQDFQTASSGGAFIITDETLHSNIYSMLTANNFLYIVGESSFNVVSDVRLGTTGAPLPTIFSNTNITALIGTNLPHSIFPYYRSIGFATRYGFYILSGATPQKISDNLDGIIPLINYALDVSGGVSNIFQILCMSFLFNYVDPVAGARPLIAIYFNKKWFFSSQAEGLTMITDAFQSGVPALFGTDGTNIWKLFSDSASDIASKVITAFWPMTKPTSMKEGLKAGVELTSVTGDTAFTLTLDSDFGVFPVNLIGANVITWINGAGVLMTWQNGALSTITWVTPGFNIYQADADFKGRYLGYTLTSNSPGYSLNGFLNQHQISTPWATRAS